MMKKIFFIIGIMLSMAACSTGPEPISLNKDDCAFCKMSISDMKFACEVVTEKGRVYKFDDIHCLLGYLKATPDFKGNAYVVPANDEAKLIPAKDAFYVKADAIKSPMEGHTLAYTEKNAAEVSAREFGTNVLTWDQIGK